MWKNLFMLLFLTLIINSLYGYGPNNKSIGFGIVLGEPTGVTVKYWTNNVNAFNFSLGGSYFGSPRLGADYLWHFNAFDSPIVGLYAAPGVAVGIGEGDGFWYENKRGRFFYKEGSDIGLAIRGVFGANIIPRNTPLEFFVELGVLVGLVPDFGSAVDVGLGMRFYP